MSHDVFIDAHYTDEDATKIGIAVLCSCGAILMEAEDDLQPQVSLDEAVDVAWAHRDCCADVKNCWMCVD